MDEWVIGGVVYLVVDGGVCGEGYVFFFCLGFVMVCLFMF